MSMNLHVSATVNITYNYPSGDQPGEFTKFFNLWQTPTDKTYEILASNNILESYSLWIKNRAKDEILPVYAKDDYLYEREPIGTKIVNEGEEHIKELNSWLEQHKEWKTDWYTM